MKHKTRLDMLMVEKGLVQSRERARALIMAGAVLVEGTRVDKPGTLVDPEITLSIGEDIPYVSRGGVKLEAALDGFRLDPRGLTILDAGASTGGFSHCLLERGAARVIAVDVGYGQFDWRLRNDPRVLLLERTNIRFLDPHALPCLVDAAVADLSFISLRLVLGRLHDLLVPGGWLVPLVKPQFEVGRADVGKGGIVRDARKIKDAVERVKASAVRCGFLLLGEFESPLKGPKGNKEFFLFLKKSSAGDTREPSLT